MFRTGGSRDLRPTQATALPGSQLQSRRGTVLLCEPGSVQRPRTVTTSCVLISVRSTTHQASSTDACVVIATNILLCMRCSIYLLGGNLQFFGCVSIRGRGSVGALSGCPSFLYCYQFSKTPPKIVLVSAITFHDKVRPTSLSHTHHGYS